jgi:hypothetical protein
MTSRLVTVILLTAEIKDLTAQITQRTQVRWSGDWNWKQKRTLVWTSSSHVNLMQPFWMHGIYVYMTSGWTWSRFRKWLRKGQIRDHGNEAWFDSLSPLPLQTARAQPRHGDSEVDEDRPTRSPPQAATENLGCAGASPSTDQTPHRLTGRRQGPMSNIFYLTHAIQPYNLNVIKQKPF